MPLETSVIDTARSASSWGAVAHADSRWPAWQSCLSREGESRGGTAELLPPTSPHQDRFPAFVLLESTANVYNRVYNSRGAEIESLEKTRGYHG